MQQQQGNNQIRQMVNFILQEAHEKANEIRIKTEHDFNIEKQMLVHNAKLAIAEEYKAKGRAREVEERIQRSTAVGNARISKMKLRDDLLNKLIDGAKESVGKVADSPAYPDLLKKLIVQGLIKIEEMDAHVLCRAKDVSVVQSVLDDAVNDYKEAVLKETGSTVDPKVTVNTHDNKMLSETQYCGGVIVTALHGRIVCDNTLDARVQLVYEELLPKIREQLWVENK